MTNMFGFGFGFISGSELSMGRGLTLSLCSGLSLGLGLVLGVVLGMSRGCGIVMVLVLGMGVGLDEGSRNPKARGSTQMDFILAPLHPDPLFTLQSFFLFLLSNLHRTSSFQNFFIKSDWRLVWCQFWERSDVLVLNELHS